MILEIVVDDISTNPKTNYKIGRNDGYSMDIDVAEILAFNEVLTSERVPILQYLSKKTNIALGEALLPKIPIPQLRAKSFSSAKWVWRQATNEEVTRAKEGSISGAVNQFTPTFKVGPDERPSKVNEYGFDSASSNGFWVVPN